MLIIARSLDQLDFPALMDVYAEGNEENALEFWPEKSPVERLRLAHKSFYEYLRDGFYAQAQGTYYIYEESGAYLSALRLESFMDGMLLEALETRPDARWKGHAKKLIKAVQELLPAGTRVYSHVAKSNTASIASHKACGFEAAYDYGLCADGEKYDHQFTFLYTA